MVYAGFWRRFAAHIIDAVILWLILIIVMIPLGIIAGGIAQGNKMIERSRASQHSAVTLHRIVPLVNETVIEESSTASVAPDNVPAPSTPVQSSPAPAVTEDAPEMFNDEVYETDDHEPERTGMDAMSILTSTLGFIIGIMYHTCFIAGRWQATPGKRVMGCVVVRRDGKRLSYIHALGRHVACILSWLPFPPLCIGFFLAGWTREKTALHDMICVTRVVRTQETTPVIATQ